ncbi:hypothetical protein ABDK00_018110 [Niabella insulamsoli]|uniref:hypothetical protein n=1 Tax=Niabella insulamsoli TaxID=3144874 RepID=UPI0031FDF8C2
MKIFLAIVLVVTVAACKNDRRETNRAVYYWKQSFSLTAPEQQKLAGLGVETFYVKYFDIAWNSQQQRALPVAKIRFKDTAYLRIKNLIPTVFITNEVFYQLDSSQIKMLAQNTVSLLKKYLALYAFDKVPELQMDCDWTATTKNKYFYFLNELKKRPIAKTLSATIRLHQLKYTVSSGIPPVDKGLLMCYNMGNLQNVQAKNSIIDYQEFKKYEAYIASYPLPLDVGLPIFEWFVLFRNDKYAGLFQNIPAGFLEKCKKQGRHLFEVTKDSVLSGRLLKAGDLLRYEPSEAAAVKKIATSLSQRLGAGKLNVVLYHCDSITLSKYTADDLEDIYSRLRHY